MVFEDMQAAGVSFSGTFKSPELPADGRVRRLKDVGLFVVSTLILLALVGFYLFTLRDQCQLDENRQWALSTLTAVFGGVLGWLIKR